MLVDLYIEFGFNSQNVSFYTQGLTVFFEPVRPLGRHGSSTRSSSVDSRLGSLSLDRQLLLDLSSVMSLCRFIIHCVSPRGQFSHSSLSRSSFSSCSSVSFRLKDGRGLIMGSYLASWLRPCHCIICLCHIIIPAPHEFELSGGFVQWNNLSPEATAQLGVFPSIVSVLRCVLR